MFHPFLRIWRARRLLSVFLIAVPLLALSVPVWAAGLSGDWRGANRAAPLPAGPAIAKVEAEPLTSISYQDLDIHFGVSATSRSGVKPGDTLTYRFDLTNVGDLPFQNIEIDDERLQGAVTCPQSTLAPGESMACHGDYRITESDYAAAEISNRATASGTAAELAITTGPSSTTDSLEDPSLALEMTGRAPAKAEPGELISYRFIISNSGNVPLSEIAIENAVPDMSIQCEAAELKPGEEATCAGSHVLTADDIEAGYVDAIATANGQTSYATMITSTPANARVQLPRLPSIALEMKADKPTASEVGGILPYRFRITNTGNTPLTGIQVTGLLPGTILHGGPIARLEPGATDETTISAGLRLEPQHFGAPVENRAVAQGQVASPGLAPRGVRHAVVVGPHEPSDMSGLVVSNESRTSVSLGAEPRLTLAKSGRFNDENRDGFAQAGETISYWFDVANVGNVPLERVMIADKGPTFGGQAAAAGLTFVQPSQALLAIRAERRFTASYTLQQEDIDRLTSEAVVLNEATARASFAPHDQGAEARLDVMSDTARSRLALLPVPADRDFSLTIEAGARQIRRGEMAPFTITATNRSKESVVGVTISDIVPSGFRYVEGSASIDAAPVDPNISGRETRFEIDVSPRGKRSIRLELLALGSAAPGKHVNRASATSDAGPLAPEATATIEVLADPIFDCGDLIGKVFDDRSGDGRQQPGELGMAGVRLATVRGLLVTTDKNGMFHVACADLPDSRIGSNFIMKLDQTTLPAGYAMNGENPRLVRLTAGKMTKLNFPVSRIGTADNARDSNAQSDRDWFYVGLADMTVGRRSGDRHIEAVRPGEYDETYARGRVAFYLKGKIKGKYLLTAAADTGEGDISGMFRAMDAKDPRQTLRRLDPEAFYPIYGDGSSSIDDAPTNGKFYVRLEQGDSHVLWGNYRVSISETEFMRIDRALYGASAVYKSSKLTTSGERRSEVQLYGAQPDSVPQRDEFLGTGGSAYFLKRQDVTIGSESATVEFRDHMTGRVVKRRKLRFGDDYTFDYLQGLLILKRPLSSATATSRVVRQGAFGGEKAYLVVEYEFTPSAGAVDGYAYGGRAQHWLTDGLRVGITGMSEDLGQADQNAYGADVRLKRSENTFIDAEFARSSGPGFGASHSLDGGLSIHEFAPSGAGERSALSWRLNGQADLAEASGGQIAGRIGGFYEDMGAGFATFAARNALGKRMWGGFAEIGLAEDWALQLNYDDYRQGLGVDPWTGRTMGGRSRRKGDLEISWQLNEYWKASFGATYTTLHAPWRRTASRQHDGSRLDSGVRLDYRADADHAYYVFGQGTLSRSGNIAANNRIGVGTEYVWSEKIDLAAEISVGDLGLGAAASLNYHPTAESTYYFGYRLDPDRALDVDRVHDLSGRDRGEVVVGARRKLDDTLSTYAERNYDLFGQRTALTQTYGVIYTPERWTIDGGIEIGTVEDDTDEGPAGAEFADFDRKAYSLAIGYEVKDSLSARMRTEARFEDGDLGGDMDTYLVSGRLKWKATQDWSVLIDADAVLSASDMPAAYRDGRYVEAMLGLAYRPTTHDRLNALFKYGFLHDIPGADQVSAVTGDKDGPQQRSQILSLDVDYELLSWLSVGAKYGFRIGQTRQHALADGASRLWQHSSAHLGILRADLDFGHGFSLLAEGRVLGMPEAATTDYGALLALYKGVGNNFKVGAGYNFGRFSDDLRDQTLDDRGAFINLVGKF